MKRFLQKIQYLVLDFCYFCPLDKFGNLNILIDEAD